MGSELSSVRKSGESFRHYLSPPRIEDGLQPPPGTPLNNESLSPQSQLKRRSFSHFSDFSLYPDRFNPPSGGNRLRTLSAGSDPLLPLDDESTSAIDEEIEAAASKMKKSGTHHHFAFFDYSMIPDKDPKAISKSS